MDLGTSRSKIENLEYVSNWLSKPRTYEIIISTPTLPPKANLILVHAMFTNSAYFAKPKGASLVDYFIARQFQVHRLDLSGYVASAQMDSSVSFESYVADIVSAIKEVRMTAPDRPIFILSHSVGGLAAMVAASIEKVDGLVAVAPAIWTFTEINNKLLNAKQLLKLLVPLLIAKCIGYIPSRALRIGDINAPRAYIDEYFLWVKSRSFRSSNIDYELLTKESSTPTLLLWGGRDKSMAPLQNVTWVANQLAPQATVLGVTQNSEFGFEGDHFSMIYGREAARSVWPKIAKWYESGAKNA